MISASEPLNTRMRSITLVAEGHVLDAREPGIASLAGLVNGPGVVHDQRAMVQPLSEVQRRAGDTGSH
jgi:hypothetical protein